MSSRLIEEFANSIEAKLVAETAEEAHEIEAAEVKGLSLFFSSLWATIKGWFTKDKEQS